jgi:hypothetical protein
VCVCVCVCVGVGVLVMCSCIYCVFVLFHLCIFILICYKCKDCCHRESKNSIAVNNNNNNNNKYCPLLGVSLKEHRERSAGEMLEEEERSVMVFGVQHTFLVSAPDGWSM